MKKLAIGVLLLIIISWVVGSSEIDRENSVPADTSAVSVWDIENASFYDDEETFKYYWGVNFMTDQAPSTKLNCRISALNNAGEEILTITQVHNVLNDNSAIPYRKYDLGEIMPTTTKAKYKAIKSFDVSCTKAVTQ